MSDNSIDSCSYNTPVGPLSVLASDDVVVAAGFCPPDDLWNRVPEPSRHPLRSVDHLGLLDDPIVRYLDGDIAALDDLPVSQAGTDLQQEVWQGLRNIPPGETRTYGDLARSTSNPRAVRAVGSACGRNLIAPIVPCHRALRGDGSLGGYYYGLDIKRWLLQHESSENRLAL